MGYGALTTNYCIKCVSINKKFEHQLKAGFDIQNHIASCYKKSKQIQSLGLATDTVLVWQESWSIVLLTTQHHHYCFNTQQCVSILGNP